jgi:uncharacterized integral membrane protein
VLYLILLLFLLACAGLVVLTVLDISVQTHFTILTWQSPDAPVGFWMLGAFFLGALLFYLVSVTSAVHDRQQIRQLRQQLNSLQPETGTPTSSTVTTQAQHNASMPSPTPMPIRTEEPAISARNSQPGPDTKPSIPSMPAVNQPRENRYIPMPGIAPMRENLPPQHFGQ